MRGTFLSEATGKGKAMPNIPISKSVDMTGDLSRIPRVRNEARHVADVGSAIGGTNYRASSIDPTHGGGDYESANDKRYPSATPVVLVIHDGNEQEYRVGLVTRRNFEAGLRSKEDLNRLNMEVAKACFGASPVYHDRSKAIADADKLIREASVGIKVLHVYDMWQ